MDDQFNIEVITVHFSNENSSLFNFK